MLGKFGGGNRKMMIEPQALEYKEQDETGPSLTVTFTDQKQPLALPVKDIIETAFNALKLICPKSLLNIGANDFFTPLFISSF